MEWCNNSELNHPEDFIVTNKDLNRWCIYSDLDDLYTPSCSEDIYMCPYGLEEICEGFQDEEYVTRCCGQNFAYMHCPLYQYFSNQISIGQLIKITGIKDFMKRCAKAINAN